MARNKVTLNQINGIENKQDLLVSGENIKTINGNDITGAGNLRLNFPPSPNPNIGCHIVETGWPSGYSNGYQGNTWGCCVSGVDMFNMAQSFSFDLCMQQNTDILIDGIVLKYTNINSSTIIDTIPVSIGGIFDNIVIPSSGDLVKVTVDPIVISLNLDQNIWIYVSFSNLNTGLNLSTILNNGATTSKILGNYASGNHLADTTITFTRQYAFLVANLKVVT